MLIDYFINDEAVVATDSSSSGLYNDDYFGGHRFGWIMLFGSIGVLIRYCTNMLFARVFKTYTFWSTLLINVTGCAVMGVIQVIGVERENINIDLRYGITIGLFGGYTTFSGYCLDTILLFEKRQTKYFIIGLLYSILTPGLGLGAAYAGVLITREFYEP